MAKTATIRQVEQLEPVYDLLGNSVELTGIATVRVGKNTFRYSFSKTLTLHDIRVMDMLEDDDSSVSA